MDRDQIEAENPAQYDDQRLIAGLQHVLSRQRSMTARLVAFIGEVDARGLYRGFAYSSMFEYAVHALHMSEGEAFPRIYAGRIARKYPVVLRMLERGELHLCGIRLIGPLLTADNHAELLAAIRFKSKRAIETFVVSRSPREDVKSSTRKLPDRAPVEAPASALRLGLEPVPEQADKPLPPPLAPEAPGLQVDATQQAGSALTGHPGSRSPSATMSPLRVERYKVQFTAVQRLHDKIKQAQHLLRTQVPSGDLAEIVERALDLLIAEKMKQRFAVGRKPAAAKSPASKPAAAKTPEAKPATPQSRHIPHEVRRQVFARDGMQCTYVSQEGKRCEQRGDLEFHHDHPFARGGEATVANIKLLCWAHNALLAERDYGRAFMRQRKPDSPRGVRDADPALGGYTRPVSGRCAADASVARHGTLYLVSRSTVWPRAYSLGGL